MKATAKTEPFIDRIFRGYGETAFGKERMDRVTSSEVEEMRCKAMRVLGELTERYGKQEKGTAEKLFCSYVAELLSE